MTDSVSPEFSFLRIHHMRHERGMMQSKAECGAAGSAKNILRIGFDSSTENRTLFKRGRLKKMSCTIRGEDAKNLRCIAKKNPSHSICPYRQRCLYDTFPHGLKPVFERTHSTSLSNSRSLRRDNIPPLCLAVDEGEWLCTSAILSSFNEPLDSARTTPLEMDPFRILRTSFGEEMTGQLSLPRRQLLCEWGACKHPLSFTTSSAKRTARPVKIQSDKVQLEIAAIAKKIRQDVSCPRGVQFHAEAYLSTQPSSSLEDPRLSEPHEDQGRRCRS